MNVAVVGGGVIGLSCAYALSRAGADVVVLERDRCGQATSLGNAGWVTPALSAPLPAPGVMAQAVRWMMKPDSPLLIRPRLEPSFLRWCWRFWRSCSRAQHRAGLEAMVALNSRTLELFDEFRRAGIEFEMHSTGLVMAGLSPTIVDEYAREFQELREAGYQGGVAALDGEALRRLEPALSDEVVGGLYADSERYVRPETLTGGLVAHLERARVRILEGAKVEALIPEKGGGWRLRTASQELAAHRVVVAGGVWTSALLAPLGVRIPLEAAKGYSITAVGRGTRPGHALYLLEAKVGCSPFADGVRLAGTLELAGIDLSLNRRRLHAIARSASAYLRDWRPEQPELEWAGLRPFAPDGLPLIGSVPGLDHLYVATGHGMLGITLAPATAAALAPLVLEDRLVPELEPFRIDRRF